MRKLACVLFCLFGVISAADLSAAFKVIKIGDFPIVGTIKHKGFILDDGNIYKPLDDLQEKVTVGWQIGDKVMLLSAKERNRFILVNERTGQKAKMKGVRW